MDKKQDHISVRINGKEKVNQNHLTSADENVQDELAAALDKTSDSNLRKEQAKTTHDFEPPKVEVLKRKYKGKNSLFSHIPSFKRLITAGASAIVVGAILGFVMLRVLSGVGTDNSQEASNIQNNGSPSAEENSSANGSNDNSQGTTVSFDGFESHVVQVGVYSTKKKANERQAIFEESGVNPFIWKQEGQFYLFAAIAMTDSSIKETEANIDSLGFDPEKDTYVKTWSVAAKDKETSETEANWIKEGMSYWEEAVPLLSQSKDGLSSIVAKMEEWYQTKPDSLSEGAETFSNSYQTFINLSGDEKWQLQHQLIKILYDYQSYINE
ncbi:hypothetical protein SAMN05421676_11917 [Salinibacillus kushneri]|uniref:SPOR domain-containing protein n=1 Tax=Salinibacillus kushneri TaxID=237682 RepID=A0A1I0JF37_9BACI|nr:hypothetical protein [Salinibacillus kushneri]SEU08759.1 hypothetical protein SAMN05421676_11917 [Salinibacillus kushneri]